MRCIAHSPSTTKWGFIDAYKIIAGFSEIKVELRKKAKIKKPLIELKIWFSFEEGILYGHDYDDHKMNIVLAVYNPKDESWRIFLKDGTYGDQVIKLIVVKFKHTELQKGANTLYDLYGFLKLGRS